MTTHNFNFNNGAVILPSEIDAWHKQIRDYFLSGKEGVYVKSSGRAMVIGTIERYSHDPDNPVIVIYEIKNGYHKYEYSDLNLPTDALQ